MTTSDQKQFHILVVEDDEIVAELINDIIEDMDLKCTCMKNGHSAIAWLSNNSPDLMILDYSLPDMNAAILTSLISHENSTIPPFIISTGMGDELIAVDMMKRGARDYLVKNAQFLQNLKLILNRVIRELTTESVLAKTQNELDESRYLLSTLIDAIPDIICFKDKDRKWVEANNYTLKLFNLNKINYRNMSNKELANAVPEYKNIFERFEDEEPNIIRNRKTVRTRDTFVTKDNRTLIFDVLKIPLYYQDGSFKGLLIVGREITDLINSIEAKKDLESKALKSQKMESLGIMAGGVAHDFNNLLTVILGHTDLIMHSVPHDSHLFNSLKEIETSSKRATELCKQMLAYSGKGRILSQIININQLIEGINSLIQGIINKKTQVIYHLNPDYGIIEGDNSQLQQLIMNLVINASEAISDINGQITIETGKTKFDPLTTSNYIFVSELIQESCIYIRISDTGTGIPKDIIDRVFDPFFSSKCIGRGLGLPACLGIVKSHNGAIKLSSDTDKGTSVTILLPLIENEISNDDLPENEKPLHHFALDKKVLIIDDEASTLNTSKEMLEFLGFSVIACNNSIEAMDLFTKHTHEIAFTIIDLSMPVLDGFELFLAFKQINKENVSIITSGYNERIAMQKFHGFSNCFFIQKPYTLQNFSEKINTFLKAHQLII